MPLPEPSTPWPPPAWRDVYGMYAAWSAWYAGDTDKLSSLYGASVGQVGFNRPAQHSDGIIGRAARWFWGTPVQAHQRSTKLHVPAASDVASTSSDLLFSQPPQMTTPATEGQTNTTQDRLDELFDERATTALAEAAEVASALSGVFLRVTWDRQVVPDRPFITAVHPDSAIPTFRWGRLVEVTFHRELHRNDNGQVWRHLEHHAPGVVQNMLYLGSDDNLGRPVPLTDSPATEGLVNELSEDGVSIPTGYDGLDVVYVPNATPTRIWRNHPVASSLGRSDLSGVESLMDQLDECYTSWMRDIRLGKGRVMVPADYLDTRGRGQGALFDADREVFTPLNMMADDPAGLTISQFAIRHEEHKATAYELLQRVVQGAGYSAQTFGLTAEVAMTATESNAKERKTHLTRGKKTRLWGMGLAAIAEAMLAIDRAKFNTPVDPVRPDVEFAPAVTEQQSERAETARMLFEANAASTQTLVEMVHPDWDADQVAAELGRIMAAEPVPPEMVP